MLKGNEIYTTYVELKKLCQKAMKKTICIHAQKCKNPIK